MHPLIEVLKKRGLNPVGDLPGDLTFESVWESSAECGPGSIFVAIAGFKTDGHKFLADAAKRGALAAVVSREVSAPQGMVLIRVDDTRRAVGPLAHAVAGDPSRSMDVVGVTGTNGKTTTVYLMEEIFKAAGRNPGILGTIVNRWNGREVVADETTPSASRLASRFRQMKEDAVDSVAMEVSSHAIDQRRIDGIRFRGMALTNVTQDHLDYHKTMEAYAAVKMSIFERMIEDSPGALGVVNLDDPTGAKLAARMPRKNLISYSVKDSGADLQIEKLLFTDGLTRMEWAYRGTRFSVQTSLPCSFNLSNCLAGAGLGLACDLPLEAVVRGIAEFRGAPGRFEMIPGLPGVNVVVDYAHTPDALTQLLTNARGYAPKRLVAVFGCGGDRDRTKRPKMGRTAAELADEVVITSDNPRMEEPTAIVDEIVTGVLEVPPPRARHHIILDRREAIEFALKLAAEGDAVVIAGKGHEDYQILGKTKIHFDDREVAREAIANMAGTVA